MDRRMIAQSAEPILEVDSLSKAFAGVQALDGYSLRLPRLAIHGVIGPNGAGKTTLFNMLTGFVPPTAGTIRFLGRDITRQPATASRGSASRAHFRISGCSGS